MIMVSVAQQQQTHNVFAILVRRCVQRHESFVFTIEVEYINDKISVDFLEPWSLSIVKRGAQPFSALAEIAHIV